MGFVEVFDGSSLVYDQDPTPDLFALGAQLPVDGCYLLLEVVSVDSPTKMRFYYSFPILCISTSGRTTAHVLGDPWIELISDADRQRVKHVTCLVKKQ